MYMVLTNIAIQQIPTDEFPNRKKLLSIPFLSSYDGTSSWDDLTQTMSIVLPKKVKVRYNIWQGVPFASDAVLQSGYLDLSKTEGQQSNIGGFEAVEPILLRGDLITFNVGYRTKVNGKETTYMTGTDYAGAAIPPLFKGYISKVNPKLPFTIECEDNMWLLKQIPTPAKQWGNMTLQAIVSTILKNAQSLPLIQRYNGYVNLTVSDFSLTDLVFNVGSFITIRGSLCQLLARIKSEYHIDSYFRGDELRIGYTHYVPEDAVEHNFEFQKNIIDDKLLWQRKDDHVLSCIVRSHYRVVEGGTTLDGAAKSKQQSTEVLVYNDTAGNFTYSKKEKGKDYETASLNDIGERFTLNIYSAIADPNKLFEMGKTLLKKYYYDGFKGSFTTFAIPYVKHGDTISITDRSLPERNGRYKVKRVRYFGSFGGGYRQEITLDYKI